MTSDRRIQQIVALRQLVVAGNLLCVGQSDGELTESWEHALCAVRETGLPAIIEAATSPCTTLVDGIHIGDWNALCAELAQQRRRAAALAGAGRAVLEAVRRAGHHLEVDDPEHLAALRTSLAALSYACDVQQRAANQADQDISTRPA